MVLADRPEGLLARGAPELAERRRPRRKLPKIEALP
jgi:hypothetical protein